MYREGLKEGAQGAENGPAKAGQGMKPILSSRVELGSFKHVADPSGDIAALLRAFAAQLPAAAQAEPEVRP